MGGGLGAWLHPKSGAGLPAWPSQLCALSSPPALSRGSSRFRQRVVSYQGSGHVWDLGDCGFRVLRAPRGKEVFSGSFRGLQSFPRGCQQCRRPGFNPWVE